MELEDFGDQGVRHGALGMVMSAPMGDSSPGMEQSPRLGDHVQWALLADGIHEACGPTRARLGPGAYEVVPLGGGRLGFRKRVLSVDDLIDFEGSLPSKIVREVAEFWEKGELFRKYGFLHRRGYILYGPQGTGKSSVVHQVVAEMVSAGNLVVFCESPGLFIQGMSQLRQIEPERPVLCVMEDIDSIIERFGDSELLQFLDGNSQLDRIVTVATTNYPKRLDKRIVARPRRFDRVIKIEQPPEEVRLWYLAGKLAGADSETVRRWRSECPEGGIEGKVRWLEGWVGDVPGGLMAWFRESAEMSFAALAELVISVVCLGYSLPESAARLRDLAKARFLEDGTSEIGFGAAQGVKGFATPGYDGHVKGTRP